MTATMKGRQWELECRGLRDHGMHDDTRCLASRSRIVVDLPSELAVRDDRLWLDADGVIAHLDDDEHEWGSLPIFERARYMVLCMPGMIASVDLEEIGELVVLEGFADAYGTLPFPGSLRQQPPWLLQAFGAIRSTQNIERMREMRQKEADARRDWGGEHGAD